MKQEEQPRAQFSEKQIYGAEQAWFAEIRKFDRFKDWTDAELRAFIRQNADTIFGPKVQ